MLTSYTYNLAYIANTLITITGHHTHWLVRVAWCPLPALHSVQPDIGVVHMKLVLLIQKSVVIKNTNTILVIVNEGFNWIRPHRIVYIDHIF